MRAVVLCGNPRKLLTRCLRPRAPSRSNCRRYVPDANAEAFACANGELSRDVGRRKHLSRPLDAPDVAAAVGM